VDRLKPWHIIDRNRERVRRTRDEIRSSGTSSSPRTTFGAALHDMPRGRRSREASGLLGFCGRIDAI
jgi:hypothetical protein